MRPIGKCLYMFNLLYLTLGNIVYNNYPLKRLT